jgi:hypothetical protein
MIIKFLSSIPCINNFNVFEIYPRIQNGINYFLYAYLFYVTFNIYSIINNILFLLLYII